MRVIVQGAFVSDILVAKPDQMQGHEYVLRLPLLSHTLTLGWKHSTCLIYLMAPDGQ